MLYRKTPTPKSGLDVAIEDVLHDMQGFTSDQDEYIVMADQLVKLHALKQAEKPSSVAPDTVVLALTNVVCVALILEYERFRIVTSKAVLFVGKLR